MTESTPRSTTIGRLLTSFVLLPGRELMAALEAVMRTPADLTWVFGGLLAGWWIYVPLHELLHAGACLLAGGSISRLEVDPLYGGALLARVFPFVEAGGEYAGRLSGFDTGGSDLVYLATVVGPFVLALLPGIWGLRRAAAARRAVLVGLALPFALAPLLSLPGDAYELGSIVLTWVAPWSGGDWPALLRGDDVALRYEAIVTAVAAGMPATTAWSGFAGGLLLAAAWAWGTVALSAMLASRIAPRVAPPAG